jgi:sterol desaturase/sphingolipid hydroxylase (fatty acid hydroxylase superfamily)
VPTVHSKAHGSLTADPVHHSTNMPKLLKNLYNEPVEKARGRFVGVASMKMLSSAPIID